MLSNQSARQVGCDTSVLLPPTAPKIHEGPETSCFQPVNQSVASKRLSSAEVSCSNVRATRSIGIGAAQQSFRTHHMKHSKMRSILRTCISITRMRLYGGTKVRVYLRCLGVNQHRNHSLDHRFDHDLTIKIKVLKLALC